MGDDTGVQVWDHRVAGRDYPKDLAQFRSWFPTDEECVAYLDFLRWPEGFVCAYCAGLRSTRIPGGYRCRGCRRRVSVISRTLLDKTHIPMTVWFEVAWLMATDKRGVSASHVHRVLPVVDYQTAWAMLAKYRSVMKPTPGERLTGRVEIDESYFGGVVRGVQGGRGIEGKPRVAGAVEISGHDWGRARLEVIADVSTPTLRDFVTRNVVEGSTVVTDAWRSYLKALDSYDHVIVNVGQSGGCQMVCVWGHH